MSSLDANSTLTDVAFVVCTALERAGEHAVLCGGSAATFYVPEKYESRDLDFVLHFGALTTTVDAALLPLGYVRAPEMLYRHPAARFTVEFPPGPTAIGSETVTKHATQHQGDLVLHVYTPTDVVRDRFMHLLNESCATLRCTIALVAIDSSSISSPRLLGDGRSDFASRRKQRR